ncbi:TPA: hypothetical protein ACE6QD_001969 [Neisseria gonorrhoeae]
MSGKEPLNRNPVIASGRECRLKYSSDGIFREGRDVLEKTAFQAGAI